jgi:hypothetical protein
MDYGLNSLTLVQNKTFHALDLNVIVIFVLVFYSGRGKSKSLRKKKNLKNAHSFAGACC